MPEVKPETSSKNFIYSLIVEQLSVLNRRKVNKTLILEPWMVSLVKFWMSNQNMMSIRLLSCVLWMDLFRLK